MNDKEPIRPKKFNNLYEVTTDNKNRYCIHCHVRLINNPDNTPFDHSIFWCQQCGVRYNVKETEPEEKLKTTFPSFLDNTEGKHVYQSLSESLPRNEYFMRKRAIDKNEQDGAKDPYLKFIRAKNIQIRNIEYYNPE